MQTEKLNLRDYHEKPTYWWIFMSVFACICSPSSSAFRFFKLSLYKFLPFINTKQHNIKEKKVDKNKGKKYSPTG